MPVREVAFELECFEWADERLEVAGRWKGLAGRRLNRPVLTVETETGRRKHLVAMPGGHFGATDESWRATFDWPGDPAEITGAELEVGGNVVVDLPLPDRRRRRRRRPAVDAGGEVRRSEVAGLRAQVERLRAELAGRERENMRLRAQLDQDKDDDDPDDATAAGGATVEIERPAAEREELTAEIERLAGERDRTRDELSAELERLEAERERMGAELERVRGEAEEARADIEDLREAFSEAAAEAEASRARHGEELAALQQELRAERATVARLSAELAGRSERPPPAPGSTGRAAAAAPPIVPPPPPGAEQEETLRAPLDAPSLPGALDAPGALRAGGRPAAAPGANDAVRPSRMPAWLRAGGSRRDPAAPAEPAAADEGEGSGAASLHALKTRLEHLFASNGHAVAADEPEVAREQPIPGPLRTASAARARAGATVAARRSPAEVWTLRILGVLLVAVLLIAFLLILTSIA